MPDSRALLLEVVADWNGHHMWGGGWMWLWGSLMMLFWVAVIAVVVVLVARGPHRKDLQ